jgi:hypothetical protein
LQQIDALRGKYGVNQIAGKENAQPAAEVGK